MQHTHKKQTCKIKYANTVFSYLETEKIFLNYDAFKTLSTASPGFLIELHPTLTRKDNLQITLSEDLAQVPINRQNSVIKYRLEDNGESSNNDQLPIPKFTIFTATRSFGNGSNRVKASVLVDKSL